jgi:hypothetical protein
MSIVFLRKNKKNSANRKTMFYRISQRAISPIRVFCRGLLLKTRIFRAKDETAISDAAHGQRAMRFS